MSYPYLSIVTKTVSNSEITTQKVWLFNLLPNSWNSLFKTSFLFLSTHSYLFRMFWTKFQTSLPLTSGKPWTILESCSQPQELLPLPSLTTPSPQLLAKSFPNRCFLRFWSKVRRRFSNITGSCEGICSVCLCFTIQQNFPHEWNSHTGSKNPWHFTFC